MSVEKILSEKAAEISKRLQSGISALKNEILKMEAQKREKEATLHAAGMSRQRSLDFKPTIGRYYQCPECWVSTGVHTDLDNPDSPVPDKFDIFVCHVCHSEYEIPY